MTPYDKLPQEERDMFDYYFVQGSDGCEDTSRLASNLERLAAWNKYKESLFHVFGEQLILRKPLALKKGTSGWKEQFERLYKHRFFFTLAYDYYNMENPEQIKQVFPIEDFVTNKLSKDITLRPKRQPFKEISFKKGMKTMRALSKIAEETSSEESYEKFRILHSTYLQEKDLSGELCLSIHPLDFLTMSDNNYKWSSCMSLEHKGDYCAGVVEMLNSACIICAYLAGDKPFYINKERKWRWSNKKWRCLFIVTEEIIMPIKGYPYQSSTLETIILDWLTELIGQRGYEYLDEYCYPKATKYNSYECPSYIYHCGDHTNMTYEFQTNVMYNDTRLRSHPYKVGMEIYKRSETEGGTRIINYSGPLTCLWCGKQVDSVDKACCVTCRDCRHDWYCDICGEHVNSKEELIKYVYDEMYICKHCASKRIMTLDGEKRLPRDCVQIIPLPSMDVLYNIDFAKKDVFLVPQLKGGYTPSVYISKTWVRNLPRCEGYEDSYYYKQIVEGLNKEFSHLFYIKPDDYYNSPVYWFDHGLHGAGINHNIYTEEELIFISMDALTTSGKELFELDKYKNVNYAEWLKKAILFESSVFSNSSSYTTLTTLNVG